MAPSRRRELRPGVAGPVVLLISRREMEQHNTMTSSDVWLPECARLQARLTN